MTRRRVPILFCLIAIGLMGVQAADVLQHHLNPSRDGLYVDPLITQAAARTTHRDVTFHVSLPGPIYAQPLYTADGPGGRAAFIVATEQNIVLAIDAADGSAIFWSRNLGQPVPGSSLECGDIDPVGITGTPFVDPTSRVIYVDAMTTPDGGTTKQHLIYALSLDDGSTVVPGWPVDVNTLSFDGQRFNSAVQNQRGALVMSRGYLYVPYGGHAGDCGDYRGWVVAIPVSAPGSATAWATGARGGGIWAPGGLASDGNSVFAATGNTFNVSQWMGGEAIIRLQPGAIFSGLSSDYFTPSNWWALDSGDVDLGSSGPLLVDVPGATPTELIVAFGKNGVAYLLDRQDLGGIGTGDGITGEGLYSKQVADGPIMNAAAAYTAPTGTYVVFVSFLGDGHECPAGTTGNLVALRINPSQPPTIDVAWCAPSNGRGSPIATTTDGSTDPVVWTIGAEGTNRLYAFNGETGEMLFDGSAPGDQMTSLRRFSTPIVVNGRIFVAGDNELYAFTTR